MTSVQLLYYFRQKVKASHLPKTDLSVERGKLINLI